MGKGFEKAGWAVTLVSMLFVGLTGIVIGYQPSSQWGQLTLGTGVYYSVSLTSGLVLLLAMIVAFSSPRRLGEASLAGALAALALPVNQVLGLRFHTILCTTPD